MRELNKFISIIGILTIAVLWVGCKPDNEGGFQEDFKMTAVSPQIISSGLNYPWGLEFIKNDNSDGTENGSVLSAGNLLVANRGKSGNRANSVVQLNPHTGNISIYSDASKKDSHGEPAVDGPYDVAFWGPFVWIANEAKGLGSVAVTDPNPSKAPNGPTGSFGEPIDGPTGTGVFGSDDFGFVVLAVTPESDAVGVFNHTKIEIRFSSPVDPTTITSATFRVEVDFSPVSPDPQDPRGSFAFSSDYRSVEFVYEADLVEATRYRITLDKDILNERGVPLDGDLASPGADDFVSKFTVGAGKPLVIWVRPPDRSSNVPPDTIIEVGFSEKIKSSTVTTSSFYVTDGDGDKIDGTVHVSENESEAVFIPDEALGKDVIYTVHVLSKVTDSAGNPLDQIPGGYPDPFSSWFSTGATDQTPPKVTSVTANETGTSVSVVFSKAIDPASRQGDYLTISNESGSPISGSISWPTDATLTFNPDVSLTDGIYMLCIEDVLTDNMGNHLDGNGDGQPGGRYCGSFAVGSNRLYITSSYPEDGNTGIGISTVIYVNFSRAINASTVTRNTFFLEKSTEPGSHISASVSVNPGNTSALLDPEALLEQDTDYTMTVTSDVADTAGNPLDQIPGLPLDAFHARFRTGGEDTQPPCILEIVPEDGATNVPISSAISVTLSESIIPSSVSQSSFQLTGPEGQIQGQFSFFNGNTRIVFQPEANLISSQSYTITLTTGISDSSGNGLDGDCDGTVGPQFSTTFTTGSGGVVINEVVVDPQQDWNDSEGGDAIPFNTVPGSGTVSISDEWVEIHNASGQTVDLTNWTLEMNDSTPGVHVIGAGGATEVFYPASATVSSFSPGAYLVIGNPTDSMNNTCYLILKNPSGGIVDDVEIGDDPEGDGNDDGAPGPGEDGNADSISNEAVARLPNGFDSDSDGNDFTKQAATLGSSNGGRTGFGPSMGTRRMTAGLTGLSSIVSAGFAPDNPHSLSLLYFVAHPDQGVVYGIDLDDGSYYVLAGSTAPSAIEFVPATDATGQTIPGEGLLFVADPVNGNIARITMSASGPAGDPATTSVPSKRETGSYVYLTYENLAEPVGIAYSEEYDRLYIACRGNGYVLEITQNGQLTNVFDTGFDINALGGIAVGDFGDGDVVFISNTGGERIGIGDGPKGSIAYFKPHND